MIAKKLLKWSTAYILSMTFLFLNSAGAIQIGHNIGDEVRFPLPGGWVDANGQTFHPNDFKGNNAVIFYFWKKGGKSHNYISKLYEYTKDDSSLIVLAICMDELKWKDVHYLNERYPSIRFVNDGEESPELGKRKFSARYRISLGNEWPYVVFFNMDGYVVEQVNGLKEELITALELQAWKWPKGDVGTGNKTVVFVAGFGGPLLTQLFGNRGISARIANRIKERHNDYIVVELAHQIRDSCGERRLIRMIRDARNLTCSKYLVCGKVNRISDPQFNFVDEMFEGTDSQERRTGDRTVNIEDRTVNIDDALVVRINRANCSPGTPDEMPVVPFWVRVDIDNIDSQFGQITEAVLRDIEPANNPYFSQLPNLRDLHQTEGHGYLLSQAVENTNVNGGDTTKPPDVSASSSSRLGRYTFAYAFRAISLASIAGAIYDHGRADGREEKLRLARTPTEDAEIRKAVSDLRLREARFIFIAVATDISSLSWYLFERGEKKQGNNRLDGPVLHRSRLERYAFNYVLPWIVGTGSIVGSSINQIRINDQKDKLELAETPKQDAEIKKVINDIKIWRDMFAGAATTAFINWALWRFKRTPYVWPSVSLSIEPGSQSGARVAMKMSGRF